MVSCGIVICILLSAHPVCADLVKITDNVYSYLDVKEPSAVNSFGANAGIIIGKDGVAVIDTLVSSKAAKQFIQDIRKITDKPIKYVINTHYHIDHAFGNSEFEKLGAAIIVQENCNANIRKTGEYILKNAGNYGLTKEDLEGTGIVFPDLTFKDRMTTDIGGEIIELIYFGPSHSTGSILVYLPAQQVLFAGDILFTDFHPFMGEGNIAGWLSVLDYMLYLDAEKIIPGHGPLSVKKDVKEMKEYITTFDKHAKKLVSESKDEKFIETELLKVLPKKSGGHFLILPNIKMKYLQK
ncbi:MAG: MBL fold metallo-hydrolase [Desulfobacteraceae bacterium]|nr:MBL fold metallo-hydrolase [Desulfobacteraceae bacterium]